MSILVPKSDKDGSQIGLHGREWSNILSDNIYSTASFVRGIRITSGTLGLLADNKPIIVSPLEEADAIAAGAGVNKVSLRLNNLLEADGDYDMGGNRLKNLGLPQSDTDVPTKFYVDNLLQGIKWKNSVRISSHSPSADYVPWKERNTTVKFRETGPDTSIYELVEGNEGWVYTQDPSDPSADKIQWLPPSHYIYENDPGSTHGSTPTGGNLFTGGFSTDINKSVSYSSARLGDTPADITTFTINFKEELFDGGPSGNNAYTDILPGDRVLVKDAYPQHVNGIWQVASTGSLIEPDQFWYLMRSQDFDESEEVSSAAVFVEEGHNNSDFSYVVTVNSSSISGNRIGTYDITWSLFGTQQSDNITIYKDALQSDRFEVTGVLRDINDLYYNYASPGTYDGVTGRENVLIRQFLVGDGTTFVAERDDVARTSLGLGTTQSPTFTNLNLTGGELTASLFVSNNSANPIELESNMSGTIDLTVNNLSIDNNLSVKDISAAGNVSATGNITTTNGNITADTGNLTLTAGDLTLTAGDLTLTAGDITTNYLTASKGVISEFLELEKYSTLSDYTIVDGNSEDSSLYNIDDALYWNGAAISGGSSLGGQQKENIEFWGGNIFSENSLNLAAGDYFVRLGVSGSHLDGTRSGTTNRSSILQIVEGSFKWLTGSFVDLDGGTIDNVDINGGTIGVTSKVTEFKTSLATIEDGYITGSQGKFTDFESGDVEITGGTIDGTDIGQTTRADAKFLDLKATYLSGTSAEILGGTIDGTDIGQTSAAKGKFTDLEADIGIFNELTASDVEISGGTLDNVEIGANSTILASTADFQTGVFTTLTASSLIVPKTSELGEVRIDITDSTEVSYIKKTNPAVFEIEASKGTFDELSGSSAEILAGNITVQNIVSDKAVITYLTGANSRILEGYGEFNHLTASSALINGGNLNNIDTLEATEITGSYIKLINELSASSDNVNFYFHNNRLQDIKTPDFTEAKRKDAVNREYIDKFVGVKISVRIAITNSSLVLGSTGNGDNVDGINLAYGDRILLGNQANNTSNPAHWQNGIWELASNNSWVRPHDYSTDDSIGNYLVYVLEGDSNAQSLFSIKPENNNIIVDADPGNNNNDILVTKISSQFGVSSSGKGLKKQINVFDVNINEGDWDDTDEFNRANLKFYSSGGETKLILSESIRVDKLKVCVDDVNKTGTILLSGSSDSYIDNVQIGTRTPANSKFNQLNITDTNKIVLESSAFITGTDGGNSSITLSEGTFDSLSVPSVITLEKTLPGEHLATIEGMLKINNSGPPNDSTQRIYIKQNAAGYNDLYFENDKIGSGGGTTTTGPVLKEAEFTSIYVTGSQVDGHGAFISGSMIVEGDLQIRGTTTTVSSSNTTLQDSIIGLGITGSHSGNEEFNNLGDRGLIFARGANQTDALPGMWWDGSKFNFAKSVTSPSSGSFGAITERSAISVGQITSSLGLEIGTGTNSYGFPITKGDEGQILSVNDVGNLIYTDNVVQRLSKIHLQPSSNPSTSQTGAIDSFDALQASPDVIVLDYSSVNTSTYLNLGASSYYYHTSTINNLNTEFFTQDRRFYLGVLGFDHDNFIINPPKVLGLGFLFNQSEMQTANVQIRRTSTGTIINNYHIPAYKYIESGITYTRNVGGASLIDMGIRWPIAGGSNAGAVGWSKILDQSFTSADDIYCIEFVWRKVGNNLFLHANYDNIITIDKNDARFI